MSGAPARTYEHLPSTTQPPPTAEELTVTADPATTVRRYDDAWAEHDDDARLAILRAIWAEEGIYTDPEIPSGVRGPHALSAFIAKTFLEFPGLVVTATAELTVIGDRAWYSWVAKTHNGETFAGMDFVEFASDGRIARLTNFYEV